MTATLSKIHALESAGIRKDLPDFRVGDTIAVHYKIVEGDKLRVQIFRGVVIKRHRAGLRSTITPPTPTPPASPNTTCRTEWRRR